MQDFLNNQINPFDILQRNLIEPKVEDIDRIFFVAEKDSPGRRPNYREVNNRIIIDFFDFESAAWFAAELIVNGFKAPQGKICTSTILMSSWIRFEFSR